MQPAEVSLIDRRQQRTAQLHIVERWVQHVEPHTADDAELVEALHHHAARLGQQRQQIDGGRLPPLFLA